MMRRKLLFFIAIMFTLNSLFSNETSLQMTKAFQRPVCQAMFGITSIAFSPDGQYIAAVGHSDVAQIWAVQTGKGVFQLQHNDTSVIDKVLYAPNNKYIATITSKDATIWDIQTAKPLYTFTGEPTSVEGLGAAFTSNSQYLLIYNAEGAVLWNIETGEKVKVFSHHIGVEGYTVDLSSTGKYLLTIGEREIFLWDLETGNVIHKFEYGDLLIAPDATFLPDGEHILIHASDAEKDNLSVLNIWDIKQEKFIKRIDTTQGDLRWSFSTDRQFILIVNYTSSVVQVWDLQQSKKLLDVSPILTAGAFGVFLPDNKRIIVPSDQPAIEENTYDVWNIEQGVKETSFHEKHGAISTIISSQDGKYIAVVSEGAIELWDSQKLEMLRDYCST